MKGVSMLSGTFRGHGISRCVLSGLVSLTLFGICLLAKSSLGGPTILTTEGPTNVVQSMQPKSHGLPDVDNYVNIPYFINSSEMTSTLVLNNNLPDVAQAEVTLFNRQGEPLKLPVLTLPPVNAERFNLAELTAQAPGDFSSGNIQIFYRAPMMSITSQITVASTSKRISFESTESSAMDYHSSQLSAIVWLPDNETQARAALTNTTAAAITVVAQAGREKRTLALSPRETQTLELRDLIASGSGKSVTALLTLEHSAAPGALIATGFAYNQHTRFSTTLPFVDRSTMRTTVLAGAHFRFGQPAFNAGFPEGTTFRAPLILANPSDQPVLANVSVDYTLNNIPRRIDLARIQVEAKQLKQIDLAQELTNRGLIGPMDDAGVQITYTGQPGSLLARLTSLNETGDFVFDTPIKDPLAESFRVSGNYPWRLDGGYNTVVHLKNTTDKEVYALVQVRYEGATYNPERMKLAAYETIAIDIRQLRDGQKKDIRGLVMPKDVASGQVIWFEEEVGSLIGRAEVANIVAGVASSFSCGGTCGCPPSFHDASMSPSSYASLVGDVGQPFLPLENRADCLGTIYGPYDRTFDSAWSSTNTSVATVSTSGSVTCLGAGSATILASFTAYYYTPGCIANPVTPSPGGSLTVFRLRIRVAGSLINFDNSDDGGTIVAGENFAIQAEAVNSVGNVLPINVGVSTSASRTLDSTETGLPTTFTIVNGSYTSPSLRLNRVAGTNSGTNYRFSTFAGGFKDFFLYTYFRVVSTREGLVGRTTGCGHVIQPNDHLVALPVGDICNRQVIVRNPTTGASDSAPKLDAGPHFPGPGTACDPDGTIGGDPYWNTGTRPRVESLTCETGNNNSGIDLGDGTFAAVGSPSQVLWRWQ